MVFVPDLEQGLNFYCEKLGHEKIWQSETSAGLKMKSSNTELVLNTDLPQEADLLVASAKETYAYLLSNGCKPIKEPFEIRIGWCAVVLDPFGNELAFLDDSKGLLRTDEAKNVI